MSEKNFNTRVINKHDTEANWANARTFIPKLGEIIIYDRDSTYSYERMKIGDGINYVRNLPFVNDLYYTKIETDSKLEDAGAKINLVRW